MPPAMLLLLSLSLSSAAAPPPPPPLLPPATAATARHLLAQLNDWIMTLDVGSEEVHNYDPARNPLNHSIFINGNFARVMLASSRLTGNETHRREGLRWCESFVSEQVTLPTAKHPCRTSLESKTIGDANPPR